MFRALTGLGQGAESGSRAKLVRGVVKVPDERLDDLARRYNPRKLTHAEVVFTDLPGPGHADGADVPRSISARFVADMRAVDLFVHVLRGFRSAADEPADPVRDLRTLVEEMILGDLDVVERRLARLAKGEKGGFSSEAEVLDRIRAGLERSRTIRQLGLDAETLTRLSGFAFLTAKPQVIVLAVDDDQTLAPVPASLVEGSSDHASSVICLASRLEMELGELDESDREDFMAEMGIRIPARDRFVREVYHNLGLVSFFTTGEDEVRAWTVKQGTTALHAAGKIHSDLERGFIRADVLTYGDLVELGDEASARRAGRLRQEGKEYVVQDGDIMTVRFNV